MGREIDSFEAKIKDSILQSPRTVMLRLAPEYNHPKNLKKYIYLEHCSHSILI